MELTNGIGPLLSGYATRRFSPHWLLIIFSIIAIFLISITPLLGGVVVLLGALQIIRGLVQGTIQPVFISTIAQAVSPEIQGRSVGLRTTMNRIGALSVPIAMGYVVEAVGIEKGFYYTGAFLIFLLMMIGVVAYRSKAFGPKKKDSAP